MMTFRHDGGVGSRMLDEVLKKAPEPSYKFPRRQLRGAATLYDRWTPQVESRLGRHRRRAGLRHLPTAVRAGGIAR